ncbi:MAG: hypothetical protein QM831_25385 [Kofleriaceae bacterium]
MFWPWPTGTRANWLTLSWRPLYSTLIVTGVVHVFAMYAAKHEPFNVRYESGSTA